MRAAMPGSKHTIVLRGELAIIQAIRKTQGVRKVKPMWLVWTGSARRRLQLRSGVYSGIVDDVVEGRLYIESCKRFYLIFPENGVGLETLRQSLSAALAQFRVGVEIATGGGDPKMESQGNQNTASTPGIEDLILQLSREEILAWAELIFNRVGKVKELEEREVELELQLEEIRKQKAQLQNEEIEVFAKALAACQQVAKCKVS